MPSPVTGPPARPLAIAHRGGALLAAENTAAAFARSAALGADWVETDLRLSADGALVCLHDDDLLRLAGDPRRVAETDLATLKRLVPSLMTLAQAIAASAPLGLLLDVKLADPKILPDVLAALGEGGAKGRAVLGLRDLATVAAARVLDPDIAILGLLPDPDGAGDARAAGADWLRLWQGQASRQRIAAAQAAGLQAAVMVGQPRTVPQAGYPPFGVGAIDAQGIARVLALGPDAVMLDDPRLLLDARPVTGLSSS
ncbi:glycerophosphodiester phosphodiesterase family protein [Bosea sp. (in: a-proteobacteria)]|uniref:glycerophosphodiester phosphodiesterase n=1 Tax=Bosea sp. (in: a-proteobacteria) TaxID=1871050 RepID=UPI002734FE6D|nr:glycerophosphodiester phosphodiesterase family protein [Bosea sp. (in: a-proteobacteria)]MDP3254669.1 glycerophosphodiester phosphodiesterase family protein [Bosea sp. (in: a-proteobacteria)]